jgi:hypothetical protein
MVKVDLLVKEPSVVEGEPLDLLEVQVDLEPKEDTTP